MISAEDLRRKGLGSTQKALLEYLENNGGLAASKERLAKVCGVTETAAYASLLLLRKRGLVGVHRGRPRYYARLP